FRLSHPKGNILTREMVQALQSALESIEPNPHLKLITIEGDGPDFSFGASVPEHAPDEIARVLPEMHALIERLLDAPAVTAAIVRGRCLGGGFELALACDFIFAAADAVMGLPEIALGVFPPAASALLPVRIGAARATRAIVTGEAHRAQEWRGVGLVAGVSPRGGPDADVEAVLKQLLLAIDRVKNPSAEDRFVALRGFSWIVEPADDNVVIAIEIPTGSAVAGPFAIDQARLDSMIRRVLAAAAARRP